MERLAENAKLNGSTGSGGNGHKKDGEHELHNEHETDPGLMFTGRFCGGLIDDIKRKAPWFLSDFTDGLNFQCLSSIMFMYFACLAPIITFGGRHFYNNSHDSYLKNIIKEYNLNLRITCLRHRL